MPLPNVPLPALIVFDFDGVLTNNSVLVSQDGTESVLCSRADGLAFDMIREAGVSAIIMSTEENPVVLQRGKKLRVEVLQAVTDKGAELQRVCQERGVPLNQVVFVGNDLNDLPAMRLVGCAVAVADSHPEVLKRADLCLRTKGGYGVAREIAEDFLQLSSKYLPQ
jgi:3-deoxy-D-manno-octulosonate 8-phosphate phosphatase (KDO 8-P phosphatase)